MRIVGHGLDLVETARVAEMLERHGGRFLDRVYTAAEQDYCRRGARRMVEHLAGRFAAKEAILKALGTGWSGGIAWTDAEVIRDASGRPDVRLHGQASRRAGQLSIVRWQLSLTHIAGIAAASAIALAD